MFVLVKNNEKICEGTYKTCLDYAISHNDMHWSLEMGCRVLNNGCKITTSSK